jgi:hypothetical protein
LPLRRLVSVLKTLGTDTPDKRKLRRDGAANSLRMWNGRLMAEIIERRKGQSWQVDRRGDRQPEKVGAPDL